MSRLIWWCALAAGCAGSDPVPDEAPSPVPAPVAAEQADEGQADAADAGMSPAQPGLLTEDEFRALHELKDAEAPPLKGQEIVLEGRGAYLSLPEGQEPPMPGVVVIHEWWGLNEHVKHWTDRLAADGYAALAVDLYDGQVATSSEQAMELMKAVDDDEAIAALRRGHRFLAADESIQAGKRGVIGWCFGGGWSLRHAMTVDDLDAAVIYYGRLVTDPQELEAVDAPILGHFGRQDEGIPVESVKAFDEALSVPSEIHLYEAGHAFANPSGARYDHEAATEAWERTRAFLAEHLKK